MYIYVHTNKITNNLQQTLPDSYVPYIEWGTLIKKL